MLAKLWYLLFAAAYVVAWISSSTFGIIAQPIDVDVYEERPITNATVGYREGFLGVFGRRGAFKISNGNLIDLTQRPPNNYVMASQEYPIFGALVYGPLDPKGSKWELRNGTLVVELESEVSVMSFKNVSGSLGIHVGSVFSGPKVKLAAVPL